MSFLDKKSEKQKENYLGKKSPFLVSVNQDETQHFMDDVLKEASKIQTKEKNSNKALYLKISILSFISFFVSIFFLYAAYYFIQHAFFK